MTGDAPRRRYKRIAVDAAPPSPDSRPASQSRVPPPAGTEKLDPKTAVSVGRITSAHGVKGELRVVALTEFPERFDPGVTLWLDEAPRTIERSRWHGREIILKLEGTDTRNDAEALRGKELQVPAPAELDEGLFYQHDIIGLGVETEAGERLGRIADVLSTGSADVYVVRGDQGELLLPAIEDVVREIDVDRKRMVVQLLEGLEFTKGPAPRRRPPSGEERRLSGERPTES